MEVQAATKITIKAAQPLALVVYREVNDPIWHPATEKTNGKFVAKVRGPYWVTAICESQDTRFITIWRMGRTLDDPHDLVGPTCNGDAPAATPEVSGTVTQPAGRLGFVDFSGGANLASFNSGDPQFAYTLPVPKGTYSLYAHDDDRLVIESGIAVKHTLSLPPIDLTTEGTGFVPASLAITHATPGTERHAITFIEPDDGTQPVQLVDLPLPDIAVVPTAALNTENQTISVRAELGGFVNNMLLFERQASRRPWRLGDDPVFVEPPQPTNLAWSFDPFGELVARWDALPPVTFFCHAVFSVQASGNNIGDFTSMTGSFIAAVNPTHVVVDTGIPGFQASWMIDYHSPTDSYTRELFEQNVANLAAPEHGSVATTEHDETIFPPGQAPGLAPNARPAAPPFARPPGLRVEP